MKERPILFSGEMVRAILDGRKTQTRRVVDRRQVEAFNEHGARAADWANCPYGQPGDRLWVRETWVKWDGGLAYRADCLNKQGLEDEDSKRCRIDFGVKWKPSIFMPRWASRITLEVTGVRVERLRDISEADCCAELGAMVEWPGPGPEPYRRDLRGCFASLWDSINAKRGYSWAFNPWVWIVEFKKV